MAKQESLYPLINLRNNNRSHHEADFIRQLLAEFGHYIQVNVEDKTLTYDKVEKLLDIYIKSKTTHIKKK